MICVSHLSFSQVASSFATGLKFDQRYTKCERKWVVIPKADTAKNYVYGYIYIEHQVFFMFDLRGAFSIGPGGRYVKDTTLYKNIGNLKYRIERNWHPVALLPASHFKELDLQPEPSWVKTYYVYRDTARYNYLMGRTYNDLNEYEIALTYLEMARGVNPFTVSVALQMAYAYNMLSRFNEAIAMLQPAIKEKPDDVRLQTKLGDVYFKLKDYDNALSIYLNAVNLFTYERSEAKGEVAFNIANIFQLQEKQHGYKIWMLKAKNFTPETSYLYKKIEHAGF
ncbi:MAG: hypothetical protein JWR38_310 [Mucilaginibacter sp.]|nr:hypothetical protein [Mucilaginibacter sp.]